MRGVLSYSKAILPDSVDEVSSSGSAILFTGKDHTGPIRCVFVCVPCFSSYRSDKSYVKPEETRVACYLTAQPFYRIRKLRKSRAVAQYYSQERIA